MSSREDDVGYARPPKSTRFLKGRSGNPKGRPKKIMVKPPLPALEPTSAALLASGSRMLTATENGRTVQLPSSEAMMRAYERLALGGNRLALKDLIRLRREEEAIAAAERRRIFDYWRTVKEEGERTLAKAARTGLPEPTLYPHPDDVHLDYETMEAKIVGPVSPQGAAVYRHNADLVCHATRLSVYYGEWARDTERDKEGRSRIGAFTLLSHLLALKLPERMRPTIEQLARLMLDAQTTSRRLLARELALEGTRLGAEFYPANATIPPLMLVASELSRMYEKAMRAVR